MVVSCLRFRANFHFFVAAGYHWYVVLFCLVDTVPIGLHLCGFLPFNLLGFFWYFHRGVMLGIFTALRHGLLLVGNDLSRARNRSGALRNILKYHFICHRRAFDSLS